MTVQHVAGRDAGRVMLYALSTCVWCKKARSILDTLGVQYDYVYVDLLKDEDRNQAMASVRRWNPSGSFPTMVINDNKCIVGFKEDEIKKALKG
jgi:glutaredoxin-like protein NrdH